MPRCLMAKKWKAYPWPDREGDPQISESDPPGGNGNEEEDEEIDVVGDVNDTDPTPRGWAPVGVVPTPSNWGPSSPTAGATAPSPPPNQSGSTILDTASRVAVLYNGKFFFFLILKNRKKEKKSSPMLSHMRGLREVGQR